MIDAKMYDDFTQIEAHGFAPQLVTEATELLVVINQGLAPEHRNFFRENMIALLKDDELFNKPIDGYRITF